eukprot:scaffold4753_cov266-Prasinococcus_capsulatus_cf.AAC.3
MRDEHGKACKPRQHRHRMRASAHVSCASLPEAGGVAACGPQESQPIRTSSAELSRGRSDAWPATRAPRVDCGASPRSPSARPRRAGRARAPSPLGPRGHAAPRCCRGQWRGRWRRVRRGTKAEPARAAAADRRTRGPGTSSSSSSSSSGGGGGDSAAHVAPVRRRRRRRACVVKGQVLRLLRAAAASAPRIGSGRTFERQWGAAMEQLAEDAAAGRDDAGSVAAQPPPVRLAPPHVRVAAAAPGSHWPLSLARAS